MRSLLIAAFNLTIATAVTFICFEAILRANPRLMLRGAALPAPTDPPLTIQVYDFHYSDGDIFFWHPDLVKPLSPEDDLIESHVEYKTDEFGFPNSVPVPSDVDIVILGRSFSMGAQASNPWPQLLEKKTGMKVLNLSQSGSGIDLKYKYLLKYGIHRNPKWVVIEILPSMDILGYKPVPEYLIQELLPSFIRNIYKNLNQAITSQTNEAHIFPINLALPNGRISLTFFSYYLNELTLDLDTILQSRQWEYFNNDFSEFVEYSRSKNMCLIFLYSPTRPNIYFSLATNPSQMKPVLLVTKPWILDKSGDLIQDPDIMIDISTMKARATVGRDLVYVLSDRYHIPIADPTDLMTEAILNGNNPFMVYDTHWSALGHEIVADVVAKTIKDTDCH